MTQIPTPTAEVETVLRARFEDVEEPVGATARELAASAALAALFIVVVATVATALLGTVATVALASVS
jgi:hypothetical protein